MQRHVWGGGSPGATVAVVTPEVEGVHNIDGWTLSTDAVNLLATGLVPHSGVLQPSIEIWFGVHVRSNAHTHICVFTMLCCKK